MRKSSAQCVSLLEARELFIEEVNHHRAEYEAGEYGEKASNACKTVDVKFSYMLVSLTAS